MLGSCPFAKWCWAPWPHNVRRWVNNGAKPKRRVSRSPAAYPKEHWFSPSSAPCARNIPDHTERPVYKGQDAQCWSSPQNRPSGCSAPLLPSVTLEGRSVLGLACRGATPKQRALPCPLASPGQSCYSYPSGPYAGKFLDQGNQVYLGPSDRCLPCRKGDSGSYLTLDSDEDSQDRMFQGSVCHASTPKLQAVL